MAETWLQANASVYIPKICMQYIFIMIVTTHNDNSHNYNLSTKHI